MAQPGLGDQLPQRGVDAGQTLALGQLACLRTRYDDDVLPGAQLGLGARERLAQEALDAITLDRTADLARTDSPRRGRWAAGFGKV